MSRTDAGGAAVVPVAVTQDEAGTIAVDGDLDYLARKADPSRALPAAGAEQVALAHEGGRTAMDELLSEKLGTRGVQITTDDATGNR